MSDLTTTTILIGAVVALARAIEWLAKASMNPRPRDGNGKVLNKAGERSTEEWEGKMRDIARNANEEMMADMRILLESRNEKMREIIRQELNNRERR